MLRLSELPRRLRIEDGIFWTYQKTHWWSEDSIFKNTQPTVSKPINNCMLFWKCACNTINTSKMGYKLRLSHMSYYFPNNAYSSLLTHQVCFTTGGCFPGHMLASLLVGIIFALQKEEPQQTPQNQKTKPTLFYSPKWEQDVFMIPLTLDFNQLNWPHPWWNITENSPTSGIYLSTCIQPSIQQCGFDQFLELCNSWEFVLLLY